jgi:hypothetical protein
VVEGEGEMRDNMRRVGIVVLVAVGGLAAFIAHQVTHPALGR